MHPILFLKYGCDKSSFTKDLVFLSRSTKCKIRLDVVNTGTIWIFFTAPKTWGQL